MGAGPVGGRSLGAPDRAVSRRIVTLAAVEAALAITGLAVVAGVGSTGPGPGPSLLIGYTVVLTALALLPQVHVEHQRHVAWLTPADGAILVGLFALGPLAFVAVAMVSEVVLAAKLRQPAIKAGYNLASMLGGYTAAAVTFAALGRTDPQDPVAWACAVAALAACAAWDLLSTAAVFAVAEGRSVRAVVAELAPSVAVSLVLSAVLGLVALILWNRSPFGALLLAPMVAIMLLSTRGVAQQRAERRHFERLYGASAELAPLLALSDTLAMVATQGRGLITGAFAICCTTSDDGSWTGMMVDDEDARGASQDALAALSWITANGAQGEISRSDLPPALREALPTFASAVWGAQRDDAGGQVVLAVFRDLPPDQQDEHRADVLGAFVAHAATVVANAGLHEDVQQALERQVVLNRQKSEFVAAVSHELRTPLAGVIGSVQTIHRRGEAMPFTDRQEMLELGLDQGARLLGLIEDLLLVAAADHDEIRREEEPVDVAALVAAIAGDLPEAVRARLRTSVDDAVGTIVSDRDKVRRILLNLLQNAGKYAPSGPIEVDVRRDGDRVRLAVSDHGPGIGVLDRERVFERFVQLDGSAARRQGGTGLGLHLCRQLTGILGGELVATEAPGGGACLLLTVPGTPAAIDHASGSAAGAAPPRGLARSPLKRPAGLPTSSGEGARPTRSPLAVPLGGGTS